MKKLFIIAVLLVSFCLSISCYADDITDQITQALGLYKQDKYSEAVSELRFAIGQIHGLQAEKIKLSLPKPLSGWKGAESESSQSSMTIMGGGLAVSKEYTKGEQSVNIEIVTESPLLQTVMMFIANPMFVEKGKKLIKVGSHKAVIEYNNTDMNGNLQIVVGNKTLVTVNGSSIPDKNILIEYANKIDFEKIKQIVGE